MTDCEKPIRILLADDQELVRMGLRVLFESDSNLELVGVANNFEETLQLSRKYVPDIILFDFMLREGICIERIPELLCVTPSCKVLILTACINHEKHLFALRQGAVGVFTLNQPISMLIKAIHKVCSGEVWLTNELTVDMLKGLNKQNESAPKPLPVKIIHSLTPRELSIARLASQGMPAKKIGAKLFISEKTVRNQLVIIYCKLGVQNHIELVLHAARLGLLEPDV